MKLRTSLLHITTMLSLILGFLFFFLMIVTFQEQRFQMALLGLLIGAAIVWLVYLAVWFIGKGTSKTMYPALSRLIIGKLKKKARLGLSGYQEKMFIETMGALLMISTVLCLAAAAFFIILGILYIVGQLSW